MADIHPFVYIVLGGIVTVISLVEDSLKVFIIFGAFFLLMGIGKLILSQISKPSKKKEPMRTQNPTQNHPHNNHSQNNASLGNRNSQHAQNNATYHQHQAQQNHHLKRCPNCQAIISRTYRFCPHCGYGV